MRTGLLARRDPEIVEFTPPPDPLLEPSQSPGSAVGSSPDRPHSRIPLYAEALGYIGGILAIAGMVVAAANGWDSYSTAVRLAISGSAAIVLLVAGFLVHEAVDPAFTRLRGFLWLLSSAATALFAGVAMADGFGKHETKQVAAFTSAAVAVHGVALWQLKKRPIQQAVCLGATLVCVGATVSVWAGSLAIGLILWTVSALVIVAGFRRFTPSPALTEGIGAVGVLFAALITNDVSNGLGAMLTLVTASLLVAVAIVPRVLTTTAEKVVVGVIGALGMTQADARAATYFSQRAGLATGLVMWGLGALLLWAGTRRKVSTATAASILGGLAVIGGAALTAREYPWFAPLFGLATAIGLIALGTVPGEVTLSIVGAAALLVNVPWTIARFFPGQSRVPLLIVVIGVLIVLVAVLLAHLSVRIRREFGPRKRHNGPRAAHP